MPTPDTTLASHSDVDAVSFIDAVPEILQVVCRATGMGFAAVARVTEDRWIACSTLDEIGFGLKAGGELKVETTICHEIRQSREAVIIEHVAEDAVYCNHPTPGLYQFQSYISVPIILSDGSFFGTLCAIDPHPAELKKPEVVGMFRLFASLIAKNLDDRRKMAGSELLSRVLSAQRKMMDPTLMMLASAEATGLFLNVDRAGFFEMRGDDLNFSGGWTAGRLPLLTGAMPSSFIGTEFLKEVQAGKTVRIGDVRTEPPTVDSLLSAIETVALIIVPIFRAGKWHAGFYINHAEPRRWATEEIRLVQAFGEQTWDAVERARIERDRKASEERLMFALEAGGGVGTWDWDLLADRVFCNTRFAELFSLAPERGVAGIPISEFVARIHADDRDTVRQSINLAVATGGEFSEEYRVVQENGVVRWIFARGRCHLDAHDSAVRFPGVVFDVTERRNRESKILESAKLESLGVLAGGIAHDFNNLLTGIMGNASLLVERVQGEDRLFAKEIVSSSERAAHLTRQMLAYSGRGRFAVLPVDLSQQVREIMPLIKPNLGAAVITLHLEDNLPAIKADPGQIQQIIMNLAINAAEAVEGQSGTVAIRTGVSEVDEEIIQHSFTAGSLQQGAYVWLEVHDTGVGMSKETQAKIFDPFFTTKFTGRGLGLAAVSGIVRGHKGALRVQSALGSGTTFKVLFPASAYEKTEKSLDLKPFSPMNAAILLVDDEELVRKIGRNILQKSGYSVLLADSGKQAVDMFKAASNEISLIVLDMTMPTMSGEEAFGLLREISPHVPIVVSSGYSEVEVVRRFTDSNIAGFIQKPYTSAQFIQKINSVVQPRPV